MILYRFQNQLLPSICPRRCKRCGGLKNGGLVLGPEWEKAHAICQQDEGNPQYDIVHALAHWIEGDEANARYWYQRVGGVRAPTIAAEWERIAGELG